MRRPLQISLSAAALTFIFCGCTTIVTTAGTAAYETAVDKRKVGAIAEDKKISTGITAKFVEDDTVKAIDVSSFCYNGRVYLVGVCENSKQNDRAVEIARNAEGVKSVTAFILPKNQKNACGALDNLAITAKVKAKLIGDKDILSTNVDVKTVNCHVVLLGIVGSKTEIKKAIAHARSVEGIRGVKSFLKFATAN